MSEARDQPVESFCEIAGCTGVSTTSRWVTIGHGDKRRVEVCWKHAEGEIDLESLSHDHGI